MDQEEKKRRKLIKAQIKDGTYVDPNLKSNVDFIRPEGMSDEEYTRKIVEMEAEKSGISPASPRLNIEPTGKIDPGFYTPRKEYPSYVSNRKKPPVIKIGPRGGRYTEDVTKEGRPYRRYCQMTQWNDKSWQKDFLNMKSHSPSDAKLLMGGAKGLKDAWRLGILHVEYERLKKQQDEQQQQ